MDLYVFYKTSIKRTPNLELAKFHLTLKLINFHIKAFKPSSNFHSIYILIGYQ